MVSLYCRITAAAARSEDNRRQEEEVFTLMVATGVLRVCAYARVCVCYWCFGLRTQGSCIDEKRPQ